MTTPPATLPDMTTRSLTHPHTGPINLAVTSRAADIRIRLTATDHATVTISTQAKSGPAAAAVRDATLESRGAVLLAELNDQGTGTVINGISIGGGSVYVGGNNIGVVNTGGGRVFVNGREVTGDGQRGQDQRIRIDAELPAGSRINATTVSGDLTTDGPADSVHARTASGDVTITQAGGAELTSVSGDIRLDAATSAQVRTTSGVITVESVGAISARTVSGDILIGDTNGHADLTSVSGDIKAGYSGPREPSTSTVSGRVRLRRTAWPPQDAIPREWSGGPRDAEPEDAVPPGYRRRPR